MDINLADEIYVDQLQPGDRDFSALERSIVPTPSMPAVHPTIFSNDNYPVQYEARSSHFCGEFRGSYWDRWKPSSSQFGHVRVDDNGNKKFHNAIDVYSPKGTPVVAVVDGNVQLVPDNGKSIGSRAWLWFIAGGKTWRFVYGHLDSFEGKNRKVSRGDVIGYSGCTGNSKLVGCGKPNTCGVLPDHVHLILMTGDDIFTDPAAALKWNIRYKNHPMDNSDCSEVIPVLGA